MRAAIACLSAAVVSLVLAGPATADSFQRYGVGASLMGLDTTFSEQTRRPGPAAVVDLMATPWDAPLAIGAHLSVGMGWNHHHDALNFPMSSDYRLTMVQLGVLLEVHQGPVALGAGVNLERLYSTMTSRDDGYPLGDGSTNTALGMMAQLAVDVASIDRGTFAALASVDRFGAPDLLLLVSGGEDDWRDGTTYMLGVAFRPR